MPVPRKLSANFVATEVDDEVLIVDLDGGQLFSLEGSARAVWRAIDGQASDAEIAELMACEHRGDRSTIAQDIASLLDELCKASLVELA